MSSIAARGLIRDDTPRRPSSPVERGQRSLLLVVAVLTVAAWLLTLTHTQALSFCRAPRMRARRIIWPIRVWRTPRNWPLPAWAARGGRSLASSPSSWPGR